MLGAITRDVGEVVARVPEDAQLACEFKYDGQRAQVHCGADGSVSLFSRHLENMTDKYPDVVALVPRFRGTASSFVLDGELVAIDRATGAARSFQALAGRGRKDVDAGSVSVSVCLYAFDLMYLDGVALLDRPLRERRELLRGTFVELPLEFAPVRSIDAAAADTDAVAAFFRDAVAARCEGLMVKLLDHVDDGRRRPLLASYEPDRRLESWLKVKKDYDSGADSLDLVPVGGWHGQGRKAKWWSPILLAVRDPDSGMLHAVCKCMSGFTDAFYQEITDKYAEDSINVTTACPLDLDTPIAPELYWVPQEVWEVRFADITLSPVYTAAAGLAHPDQGLSIRFPRFVRRRDDKSVDDASTPEFLADLYRRQETRGPDAPEDPEEAPLPLLDI
ncbi:ATP dependent DNA ligase domain-containing protein [Dipodascopsis tothii]|uniref:ATP dependent DNA ligase domain-containing protein n=1 Tax=Dipodascopsis tothii TaxID=44089 RepID=UPI0034CE93E5